MRDNKSLIEELIRLYELTEKSQRDFAKDAGLDYAVVGRVERGETKGLTWEVILKWLEGAGYNRPLLWLAQFLSSDEKAVITSDLDLIATARRALRITNRRKILEPILKAWQHEDEQRHSGRMTKRARSPTKNKSREAG